MDVKIENMVCAITLETSIDLRDFVGRVKGIEYNPENFPGAIYRIHEPKLAMLIFSTGKVICTGARSEEAINSAITQLIEKLSEGGVKVNWPKSVELQNIVASADMAVKVNLDILAIECLNAEYEPEQFPGLVYRLKNPKTVMLIFSTGKIVITGAKTVEELDISAEKTFNMVKKHGAIFE